MRLAESMNGFQTTNTMTVGLPHVGARAERRPAFQRFSGLVSRIGVLPATLLLALASSLGSLGLTWIGVRMLGHASMGNAFWLSLLVPLPLTLVAGGICCFLVVSLDRAWSTVNELAMQDTLTGLSNRRHFMPAAQRELELASRHQQALALLILDVDHFKNINDAFGHLAGDDVLMEISARCQGALRATDLLARWGGEEFIMLLPNTPLAQACQLAERVRETIVATPHLMPNGQVVRVTASLGAAGIAPGQPMTLDELIKRADEALYRAKSDGRDRVFMSDTEIHPVGSQIFQTEGVPQRG